MNKLKKVQQFGYYFKKLFFVSRVPLFVYFFIEIFQFSL